MAPSKTAAKQNSGTSITNEYQRTAWRRKQLNLKKLKAEMEEIKVEMEKIRAEVYIISQGQKHLKGKRSKGKEKAGMEQLVFSTLHRVTGEQGTKQAHANKRQRRGVKFNKQLKRKKTIPLRMEAVQHPSHQFLKRQRRGVKFNKQLKRKKTTLLRMEAEATEARAETSHMREGAAEMAEAIEEKEADLELLRMLHNQLFVGMLHISEAEERLMEILLP